MLFRVDRHDALTRLQQRLDYIAFVARAAVVHPIHFAVLEHRVVVAGTTLPRGVERQDIACGSRPMQLQINPQHRLNEIIVYEELPIRTNMLGCVLRHVLILLRILPKGRHDATKRLQVPNRAPA